VLLGNNTRFLKTQQFSISKHSPVSVGFLTSQLGGIRISYNPPKPLTAPFTPAIQPLVARKIFSLSLVFLRSGLIKVLDCDFFFFWIKYHCRTTLVEKPGVANYRIYLPRFLSNILFWGSRCCICLDVLVSVWYDAEIILAYLIFVHNVHGIELVLTMILNKLRWRC